MPLLGSFGASSFGLGKLAAGGGLGVTAYDFLTGQTSTNQYLAAWQFGSVDTLYSDYEHLEFWVSINRGATTGAAAFNVSFNGDNNPANYYRHVFAGNGSSFSGGQANRSDLVYYQGGAAEYFSGGIIQILNPFNPNKRTVVRAFSGGYGDGTEQSVQIGTSVWNSTAVPTTIRLWTGSYFDIGSQVRMYGLKASA